MRDGVDTWCAIASCFGRAQANEERRELVLEDGLTVRV